MTASCADDRHLSYHFDDANNSDIASETVTDTSSIPDPIELQPGSKKVLDGDSHYGGDEMTDEELNEKRVQFLAHSPGRRRAYRVRRRDSELKPKHLNRRSYIVSHITVRAT